MAYKKAPATHTVVKELRKFMDTFSFSKTPKRIEIKKLLLLQ